MSGLVLAVALAALVALAVGWPLFAPPPASLGRGLEDDAPLTRWEAERTRLIAAMRDNDLAHAEGRLDAATHQATAARLSVEAETVLRRLRAARGQFAPEAEGAPPPARHRLLGLGTVAAVLVLGLGAARLAQWQDLDLTVNPHANGALPMEVAQAAAPAAGAAAIPGTPVLPDAVGGPGGGGAGPAEITAMVGQLEVRVARGGASADEIKMLLRSYDTLGRLDDARRVLEAALPRFPDDTDLQLGWLRAVISMPRDLDADAALPVAERLIAAVPDLLEARWYRALLLVREGRRDEARAELVWIHPQLPPQSPTERAVAQLIDDLSRPPG